MKLRAAPSVALVVVASSGLLTLVACDKPAESPVPAPLSASASASSAASAAPASPMSSSAPAASSSAPVVTPPSATPSTESPPSARVPAKEGEMCGGIAGIACGKGLTCGNVMKVPDGSGTCRKANK